MLLPVRPRPMPGEATPGYLMRMAEANGHTSPRDLWYGLKSEGKLYEALDLTVTEQACLFGPMPGYWKTGTEDSSRDGQSNGKVGEDQKLRGLSVADFNHDRLRWCPLCLMDASHVRGIWLMKLCCVCTEHKIVLHEQCPNCGSHQGLLRPTLNACGVCGKKLKQGDIRAVSPVALKISQALILSNCSDKVIEGFPPLSGKQWVRLVIYLGQYTETDQPDKPGKVSSLHQLEVGLDLINNLAHLLDQWPKNFRKMLRATQLREIQSTSLRKTFGKLINVLYRQLAGSEYQFLRAAFEHYLGRYWQGQLCKRHRLFKAKTINNHPRLTIPQAAKLSGSTKSLVRQCVQAEKVPVFQPLTGKKRRYSTISQQQLGAIAALAKTGLTLGQAAQQICLPEHRLKLLIANDVIRPLVSRKNFHAAQWRIPGHEITKLWFRADVIKVQGITTVCFKAILRHYRLSDMEFIGLVKALINKGIKPVSSTPSSITLGMVQLDKCQFKEWLGNYRVSASIEVIIDAAAKQLGLKQQVAGLVKNKLLSATCDNHRGYRVSQVQITEFKECFVSLADLARQQHTSPRKLLESIAVKPDTGPMVDGSRQYFYRRADLAR